MKEIVISYDDVYEGNDEWEEFVKLHEEFPNIKLTFFVITGKCSDEFLKKIKTDWIQLVFHSWEHSGVWLTWTKEEAKEWLLKFQSYGFEKGFKAPGWKLTQNLIDACMELDFWIGSINTIPVPTKHWYTLTGSCLTEHDGYVEFFDHIQHQVYEKSKNEWYEDEKAFHTNLEILKEYCRNNEVSYKFISEVVR